MATPRFDDERVNPADYDTLKGKVKNALELNLSPEETIRVIHPRRPRTGDGRYPSCRVS
jgi:hypothetical protein